MSNVNKPEKFIWLLFLAVTAYELIDVAGNYFAIDFFQSPLGIFLKFSLPLLPLIPHACIVLGKFRGLSFLLLSFFVGLLFEIIGVKYGVVFGGGYSYRASALMIGGVPLFIPLCWMIFIYTGYSIVNFILFLTGRDKPEKNNNNYLLLIFLIAMDGLAVLSIDLFLEPVQVAEGYWIWNRGGPYFGIPTGNFAGWFIVAAAASGIFRTFEYFFPSANKSGLELLLISLAGYAFIYASTLVYSVKLGFLNLIFIGGSAMFSFILIGFVLFAKRRLKA